MMSILYTISVFYLIQWVHIIMRHAAHYNINMYGSEATATYFIIAL